MKRNNIRHTLKVSLLDGIFASCMLGLTSDYITPYALALKARVSQIGILNALPYLISSLVQLKSAEATEKFKSKKKVIVLFVLLHTLMGLPILFIPYIFKGYEVISLIVFVTLFASLNAFAGPVWLSLMSDYLPMKKRGSYFGWRNKIFGIINISCVFIAGFVLYLFKFNILKGFFIIFASAFVCRIISWYFLTQMYEPPFRIKKEDCFSFVEFIKRAGESNFLRFVVFVAALNFSVNLAAPFFSVFMLKDLRFNYLTYTILISTVSIASILTIGRWGRNADRVGTVKVLRTSSLLISSLPFLWIMNQNPAYLVIIQIISGFAWAGFNLCATNFIYDAVSPAKRTRCIAYFNVINGVALCLGALIGGYLAKHLPVIFGYKLLSLFFISGILRFLVVGLFSRKLKEVRTVEDISARDLFFSVVGIKPAME